MGNSLHSFRARKVAGLLLVWSGAVFLSISCCAKFSLVGDHLFSGAEGMERVQACAEQVRESGRLDVHQATEIVFNSTKHSIERKLEWNENWLQWMLGNVYVPLSRTQNSRLLLEAGIADCSERALILKSIAEEAGYECAFVGLSGHVVLEIVAEDGPWIADADYGCVFHCNLEQWCQKENLNSIAYALMERGYSSDVISNYIALVQSTDDNRKCPSGSPLSPRLFAIERMCEYLIWALPLAFIGLGLPLLKQPCN